MLLRIIRSIFARGSSASSDEAPRARSTASEPEPFLPDIEDDPENGGLGDEDAEDAEVGDAEDDPDAEDPVYDRPLSRADVEAELYAVVAELDARAERMAERPDYWGYGVIYTRIAARACRRALAIMLREDVETIDLDLLAELLAVSRNWFCADYGDDDSIGGSCYLQLARKAIDIQRANMGRSRYGHDEDWDAFGCYGRFSEGFIRYLNSPIELGHIPETLLMRDYARCFDTARLIEDVTQRRDMLRLALRHQLMLSKRLGDEDAVDRILAQIAQHFPRGEEEEEDRLDAMAAGEPWAPPEEAYPLVQMRMDYWEGTRRKSDGDPSGRDLLDRAFRADFDADECYLASADLGIPWHERMLAADVRAEADDAD